MYRCMYVWTRTVKNTRLAQTGMTTTGDRTTSSKTPVEHDKRKKAILCIMMYILVCKNSDTRLCRVVRAYAYELFHRLEIHSAIYIRRTRNTVWERLSDSICTARTQSVATEDSGDINTMV